MTLGWPAAAPAVKPRLPLNAVLHWETYDRRHEDQALSDYDREMRQTGIYEGRQVPVSGKPEETEDYGWLEHCARRVSQPTRTELREILRRQGFELE
jgi:FMN reductase (NADPH)